MTHFPKHFSVKHRKGRIFIVTTTIVCVCVSLVMCSLENGISRKAFYIYQQLEGTMLCSVETCLQIRYGMRLFLNYYYFAKGTMNTLFRFFLLTVDSCYGTTLHQMKFWSIRINSFILRMKWQEKCLLFWLLFFLVFRYQLTRRFSVTNLYHFCTFDCRWQLTVFFLRICFLWL